MTICPDCGFENIDGADTCESCRQSLTALSAPQPATPLEKSILTRRIRELNPNPPLVVRPQTPVGDVLNLLVDNHVGCIVVVEDGLPVGIFSERDALIRLNTEVETLRERPVCEFMTPNPQTLTMDDKIAFALQRMAGGGYRHIPILEQDRLLGVISIRDILRYATENLLQQV